MTITSTISNYIPQVNVTVNTSVAASPESNPIPVNTASSDNNYVSQTTVSTPSVATNADNSAQSTYTALASASSSNIRGTGIDMSA